MALDDTLQFIGKERILNHWHEIQIPDGANLLRTKKGYVRFFSGVIPKGCQNGWTYIALDARKVFFPNYRTCSGDYGNPEFTK